MTAADAVLALSGHQQTPVDASHLGALCPLPYLHIRDDKDSLSLRCFGLRCANTDTALTNLDDQLVLR